MLKPPVFESKDDLCQRIIAAIQKGGEGPKHEVFFNVSEQDYHYILNAIESDNNLIRKPSYIPCLKKLSVNLPTPVHKSILAPLRTTMGNIISSLPLPPALHTALRMHMNTMVKKGEDNEDDEDKRNLGIPDMLIQREMRDAEFHPLWPFEVLFSQSSELAESKIQLFADKNPHVEGATHFHIAEAEKHALPSDEWAIEQELDKKKVGHIKEGSVTPTRAPALPTPAPALLDSPRGGAPPAPRTTAVWTAMTPLHGAMTPPDAMTPPLA
ncbi:uncharacterized protein F5147DRAFT_774335 [Suillus discolor]|uniref:Uncharacterized protein n=1 Tax=Suillus discolor TaxID=1912936 RepID=A0A9P7JTM8_9AGAM|nr:uncharacterized protein F5147DRAFT_774335 [Suillus discolor]KAG2107502.1 hypothetical protein F5147DRAFT_774335 [Suillus discolor]